MIMNKDNYSITSSTCPVSGLPIINKPEWTDIDFGKNYQVTFSVIGENILLIQPSGYSTLHDIQRVVRKTREIVHQVFSEERLVVAIMDYAQLEGIDSEARRYFINYHKEQKRIHAVIIINTSLIMKISVELAKKLNVFPFQIYIAKNYSNAVQTALDLLSKQGARTEKGITGITSEPNRDLLGLKGKSDTAEEGSHWDAVTNKDWKIETEKFSVDCELINENISHWKIKGFLDEEHLDSVIQLCELVHEEMSLIDHHYYNLIGIKEMKGMSLGVRKKLLPWLKEWYIEHPFKADVIYGSNLFLQTLISVSKVFIPFKVKTEKSFESALQFILYDQVQEDKLISQTILKSYGKTGIGLDQVQSYFDELQQFLGSIEWDTDKPADRSLLPRPSHPFEQLFNVIALIKEDLDRLFQELKTMETALKNSEEKYRNILESIEEGYYELDLSGNLVFFNDAMVHLLGYSREKLSGMNYKEYIEPENLKKVYEYYHQVYRTGAPLKGVQYKIIRKDGKIRIFDVSISLIRDQKGHPTGFRGIRRDMTHQIRSEQEKRELEQKLQHARRMEALGTLAGGVAHDLNNILSGLVSYPELILLDLPNSSPLRRPIEAIKASGEKSAAIVQDLLTLARRGIAVSEVLNLNDIIKEYLKSPEHWKIISYHPQVEVETDLDNDLLNISGSPVHLTKSLMNLVSNAAEAMPNGGKITISSENRHLDKAYIGYEEILPGDYVVLIISDEGIGIPQEDRQRIFEPFFTKKVLGRTGTGLGMAVVWGTLKDHKGFVDIRSTEGGGANFSLYFPVEQKKVNRTKQNEPIEMYRGNGETILIVDDVDQQREIATKLLEKLGYHVDSVSSGEEAEQYISNNRVHLLLLDMIMPPGMDGLETYQRILHINPHQKAIIASGFSETEKVKEAQRLGAGAYIKKPYLLSQLGMAVKKELNRD